MAAYNVRESSVISIDPHPKFLTVRIPSPAILRSSQPSNSLEPFSQCDGRPLFQSQDLSFFHDGYLLLPLVQYPPSSSSLLVSTNQLSLLKCTELKNKQC